MGRAEQEVLAQHATAAMAVLGLTQDELAEASGVSQSALSQLLNAESDARLDTLIRISGALHLTINQLTGQESPGDLDAVEQALVDQYRASPAALRPLILAVARAGAAEQAETG